MLQSLFSLANQSSALSRQFADSYQQKNRLTFFKPISSLISQPHLAVDPLDTPARNEGPTQNSPIQSIGYVRAKAHGTRRRTHSVKSTPSLSPIWTTLPREIVDEILSQAYYLYRYSEPVQVWGLRELSFINTTRIENFFARHWVSRLRIRVCFSDTKKAIYVYNPSSQVEFPSAWCKYLPLILDHTTRNDSVRYHFDIAKRLRIASETVALEGESKVGKKFVKRMKRGFLVECASTPYLRFTFSGNSAKCDWRRMLTAIFEREMGRQRGQCRDDSVRWGNGRFEVDIALFEGFTSRCYCHLGSWQSDGDWHMRGTKCS